ncbi:MAG TPA: type IV secretion system protein VirB10 [Caulobacteraceae bacterium]
MSNAPEPPDSPVFAHARMLTPRVRVAAPGWTTGLGLGAAALLGVMVFATLAGDRHARLVAADRARRAAAAAQPVLAVPPPVNLPPLSPTAPPPALPPAATQLPPVTAVPMIDPAARRRLPALVVDFSSGRDGEASAGAAATPGAATPPGLAPGDDKLSADERFAARIGATTVETARASRLSDPSRLAPQGTVIPAILETAIDSDLPGFTRAVVSRDVRGFDGTRVLIPRGTKLVGQYRSGIADGQSRVFVVWSRLLTPEGVSIEISSPAADPEGRAGLAGQVNNHFFRVFGASILLSVLSGAIDAAAASQGANTAIVIGSPTQATNLADIALQRQINIGPTIKIPQGEPIRVFVARDLDFSSVTPAPPP